MDTNYKKDFLNFIETKFCQNIPFPRISLYGILEKRIQAVNSTSHNPYSQKLCSLIISIFDNDLRRSIHNSVAFLEYLSPSKGMNNNPSFISEFFVKNFTKIMTKINVFPNIYFDPIVSTAPIEKDLFLILATHNSFYSGFLGKLSEHYKDAYAKAFRDDDIKQSYLINFDMNHINKATEYLVNQRLINEEETDNFYTLTNRGASFVKFVTENLYTEHCEKQCIEHGNKRSEVFWKLAKKQPEFYIDRSEKK